MFAVTGERTGMQTIIIQLVVVIVLIITIISVLMYSYLSTQERLLRAECLELAQKYKLHPEDYMTIEELLVKLELELDKDWDITITDVEG